MKRNKYKTYLKIVKTSLTILINQEYWLKDEPSTIEHLLYIGSSICLPTLFNLKTFKKGYHSSQLLWKSIVKNIFYTCNLDGKDKLSNNTESSLEEAIQLLEEKSDALIRKRFKKVHSTLPKIYDYDRRFI